MRLKHPLPFGAVLQPSQLWGRYSSRRVHVHPRNGRFQSGNQIRQRLLPLPLSGTNGSAAPVSAAGTSGRNQSEAEVRIEARGQPFAAALRNLPDAAAAPRPVRRAPSTPRNCCAAEASSIVPTLLEATPPRGGRTHPQSRKAKPKVRKPSPGASWRST